MKQYLFIPEVDIEKRKEHFYIDAYKQVISLAAPNHYWQRQLGG